MILVRPNWRLAALSTGSSCATPAPRCCSPSTSSRRRRWARSPYDGFPAGAPGAQSLRSHRRCRRTSATKALPTIRCSSAPRAPPAGPRDVEGASSQRRQRRPHARHDGARPHPRPGCSNAHRGRPQHPDKVGATVTMHEPLRSGRLPGRSCWGQANPHRVLVPAKPYRPCGLAGVGRRRPHLVARPHHGIDGGADRPDGATHHRVPVRTGSTETGPVAVYQRIPEAYEQRRQHRPRRPPHARTRGQCRRADGPGVPGEVLVRGERVAGGYWDDPEGTAKAFASLR